MDLILAIDDDTGMLKLLETQLSRLGFSVATAAGGKAGIEMARTGSPALILLDIIMPVMDGFAALRALRQDSVTSRIPVIMVSSQSEKSAVISAMRLGVSDYIVKPYDITSLKKKIDIAIAYSRMQKYEHEADKSSMIEVKRGNGRTAVIFNAPLGMPGMTDQMKRIFNHSFMALSARDALILDLRETDRYEAEDAKILSVILALFPSRKVYIIAGRHYGAIVESSDLEISDRVSLFISPGDMEMELSEG